MTQSNGDGGPLLRRRRQEGGWQQSTEPVAWTAANHDDNNSVRPFIEEVNNNKHDNQLPLLRRSSTIWGSSASISRKSSDGSLSLTSSVVDDGDDRNHRDQDGKCWITLADAAESPQLQEPASSSLSSTLCTKLTRTIHFQVQGMTNDFVKSGLPWSGKQCQSLLAGGTGILYCLPALAIQLAAASASCRYDDDTTTGDLASSISFFHHNHHLEQAAWILQAFLSVMADYVHIHHDSIFHGLDRYYATYNTVATLLRAAYYLPTMTMLALGSLPIACFVLANRAKTKSTCIDTSFDHYLQRWHWCHGAWNVTGSIAVAVAVYWMHGSKGEACYRS